MKLQRESFRTNTLSFGVLNAYAHVESYYLWCKRRAYRCFNVDKIDIKTLKTKHLLLFICVRFTGNAPSVCNGTLVIVPLVDEFKKCRWEAKIVEQCNCRLKLSVYSLATAAIGRYRLSIVTCGPRGKATSACNPCNDIYMLFNPWCKGERIFWCAQSN